MKPRQLLVLGLAGLGFVLTMPVQAALAVSAGESAGPIAQGFVIAQRDNAEGRYEQRRDTRDEERARANKNHQMRDAERSLAPQEYGYGYERRQQPNPPRDEGRHRH